MKFVLSSSSSNLLFLLATLGSNNSNNNSNGNFKNRNALSSVQAFAPTPTRKHSTLRTVERRNTEYFTPLSQSTVVAEEEETVIQHRDEYDSEAWSLGFQNVESESCYELDISSTSSSPLPDDLVGTFFQNGHAKFYVSDTEFHAHPFDADGMVQAVTFPGGGSGSGDATTKSKPWFRNRYVQTTGYLQEQKEQKICKRGVFGTARNQGKWYSNIFDVDFKNVANTHCLFMGNNDLFALWEAGAPYQMNPTTLETIGESTLYGAVDGKGKTRYAAHYKIDPMTQNVCGFAILPGDSDPANSHNLCVMEHENPSSDSNEQPKLLYQETYPFDGLGMAHDCAITEHYFIFLQAPFEFKPIPLILGLKGASECIEFDETAETGKLILIPRQHKNTNEGNKKKEPIVVPVPPYFSFHTSNAFEDEETGEIVLDMVVTKTDYEKFASPTSDDGSNGYPSQPMWETVDWNIDVPANELCRIRIDPIGGKLVSQTSLTSECATVEFPVVNPKCVAQDYTYVYCSSSASATNMGPLQGLAKFNVKTGRLLEKWIPEKPSQYINEICFCPKVNPSDEEDDGYLMTYMLDAREKTNELVIFDAAHPGKGPIARAPLKGWSVNHSLHGVFVPGFAPELTAEIKASFEFRHPFWMNL